ncbi:wiskott-Aldrich syndrome protein homolog [Mus pahari]|uniref:wiskott-Aldrich syndrome protein homolog n=1 Tax=Mus pahari TaxID=10093 RepID=UPI000A306373|nr:wiskott-Aldrich syndrome protein homolog [Mus pahari]
MPGPRRPARGEGRRGSPAAAAGGGGAPGVVRAAGVLGRRRREARSSPHPPWEGAGTRRHAASRLPSHTPAHKDASRRREQGPAAGAGAHGAPAPGSPPSPQGRAPAPSGSPKPHSPALSLSGRKLNPNFHTSHWKRGCLMRRRRQSFPFIAQQEPG